MTAKQLIKEAYVSPLVAWGLGQAIGYPSILGSTALGYGMAEAASTLNAAERRGEKKDYGEALEQGISGGVGGTIGSLLGVVAGLAAIPLLKGRGVPLGLALGVPLVSGKIGGIAGMKALSGGKKQPIVLDRTRFSVTPPGRRLKYVKGKGVVKTGAAKKQSSWKKSLPYAAGASAAGLGLVGGYGATRLLKQAMKRGKLSKPEVVALLGVTIPGSLAVGHKAGTWLQEYLKSKR